MIAVYLVRSEGENGEIIQIHVYIKPIYIGLILKKIRMDYSCHGRYKGIHIVFSMFSLLSS